MHSSSNGVGRSVSISAVLCYACALLVWFRCPAETKRPLHPSFKSLQQQQHHLAASASVLKDRNRNSDKLPSYLPTTLLKDRGGHGESRLPEPLLQTAMTYYQTLPSDVDPEELMRKLGPRFDAKWMSVERPRADAQRLQVAPPSVFDPELLSDLRRLNFTYVDGGGDVDSGGGGGAPTLVELKPHLRKIVEKWLLQKSSCPVSYRWEDVGPFFWPRWLRKGSCSDDRPCSWPPGMHCVPSPRPMTVRILRWHCRPRLVRRRSGKRNDRPPPPPRDVIANRKRKAKGRTQLRRPFRLKCRWRKVRYPITTECFCTC